MRQPNEGESLDDYLAELYDDQDVKQAFPHGGVRTAAIRAEYHRAQGDEADSAEPVTLDDLAGKSETPEPEREQGGE